MHVDDVASLPLLLSGLRDRKYDLVITRSLDSFTVETGDLQLETLFADRMVIVAGARSRWASRRKIELAELINEPWILSESGTWNYERLKEACLVSGLDMPKATLLSLSVPLRAYLVATGSYITAFPEAALPLLNAGHHCIKQLPVALPDRPWPIVAMTLKGRTQTSVVERFIKAAHTVAKSYAVDSGNLGLEPSG